MIERLAVSLLVAASLVGVVRGDDAPASSRTFEAPYDDVWQATLRAVTVELKMNVKALERSSGLIQFDSEGAGGNRWGDANELVETLTTRKVRALSLWSGFLVDCSALLEKTAAERTTVTLNTSIQGFGGWKEQWVELQSNGTIEGEILDAIERALGSRRGAAEPAPAPPSATAAERGMIELSSTPAGADVEVDGAFVGQTPAVLKLSGGKHEIRVSKQGHESWVRTLTVLPGSTLPLAVRLEKR